MSTISRRMSRLRLLSSSMLMYSSVSSMYSPAQSQHYVAFAMADLAAPWVA